MISAASPRRFWENRASALAWRINLAAWLARAAPATFFVASAFAIAFYGLRRAQISLWTGAVLLVVAWIAAGVACWWRARRGFYRPEEARVLLESHLRLDTRLTAASLGLMQWPTEPLALPEVVRWRLGPTSGWFGGALALLALAVVAPIPKDSFRNRPSGPPPALLQTESMLNQLQEMKIAEPQAIEQLQERAQELAKRPPEQQYSHSALEAADALKNQTAVAAANLGRGLDAASNAMRAANGPDMKGASAQLQAALAGLRGGAMPASKDLLSQLPGSELDLKNLTAEQREALAQLLAGMAAGANGVAGAAGNAEVAQGSGSGQGNGRGRGRGRGEGNDGWGSGGEGGGGGHAPFELAKSGSDAGDGSAEALKNADALKRFAMGDKLGTSAGAHEVDPSQAAGPMSAGDVASPASGGEAVWVNRLTPAERTALKKHFK